ncbi:hypothetical protein F511_17035 [Dorcoceras hygrometricum]|uniref:Uncharacterized protein n=1 Tax=Dorcoceras hygrometricum TaxID=472368 RepID=A0A2Z7CD60_9LAMI|nr:hypothetical protein F511_17035 [Dorcoceras hygrometricum]
MSLFDLQDICIAIGSPATLDLPMVVDLIGIYVLKGPYCTLTTTNWFLQELSVIPRRSWGDVARRFTMIRWAMRIDRGRSIPVVDRIGGSTNAYSLKCRFPRETGWSQAPRRQQVGSGSATANPNSHESRSRGVTPSNVKVPLEEFDPQTQSPSLAPGEFLASTPALGCVNHLFYAYVRKATDTEFNVFVLGRDLILHFGFEIYSLYNIAQLSRM